MRNFESLGEEQKERVPHESYEKVESALTKKENYLDTVEKSLPVQVESPVCCTEATRQATDESSHTHVDKVKSIPTVLRLEYEHNKPHEVTLE